MVKLLLLMVIGLKLDKIYFKSLRQIVIQKQIFIILFNSIIFSQLALPTFHGAQKSHSTNSDVSGTVYTFSNCGATGANGPTQSQVNSTYSSGNSLNGAVTINTQGIQEWTVPASGSYIIEAFGAEGGNGYSNSSIGGRGARIKGTFSLSQGQVIMIIVGQMGGSAQYVGGGGGGSFVWISGITSNPLIAAGGGGGGGHSNSYNGVDATTSNNGTNGLNQLTGGGTNGSGGVDVSASSREASGGAGWLSNGNDGTVFSCESITKGGTRPLEGGIGGAGGGSSTRIAPGGFGGGGGGNARCGAVGGGGGGGYSGGGAGAEPPSFDGGGGGGSYNSGSDQSNSSGVQESHGYIIITAL